MVEKIKRPNDVNSSRWWNERINYVRWGDPEYNIIENLEAFKRLIDLSDSSLKKNHLNALLNEAKKKLNEAEKIELMKYIIEEIPHLIDKFNPTVYEIYRNRTGKRAWYTRNGDQFLTKDYLGWFRGLSQELIPNRYEEIDEIGELENLSKNIDEETKLEEIEKFIETCLEIDQKNIEKHLKFLAKKTKKKIRALRELKEMILFKDFAKNEQILIDMSITREQIQKLCSRLDLNRPAAITGMFLVFEKECGFQRSSICLTLLPNIEEFRDKILKKYPMFIIEKFDKIYLYDDSGVYVKQLRNPEEVLDVIIRNEIPFYVKQIVGDSDISKRINTISKEIIPEILVQENDLNVDVINLKNGILKIDDIKCQKWNLLPHDPKYRTIFQLQVEFSPFGYSRNKILYKNLIYRLGEQAIYLFKLFGIALLRKPYVYKIVTFLVGPSGTGKSEMILNILESLIDWSLISHVSLHDLCNPEKTYASGELLGKILNIHGDVTESELEDPSEINRLTERIIDVNKKWGFKGEILNMISHFQACNLMPVIASLSRTDVFRRIMIIDVRGEPIPENEREPYFFEKLIDNDSHELSHVFNVILDNLSLVLNGDLDLPTIAERKKKYLGFSQPLRAFLEKYVTRYDTDKNTKIHDTCCIERNLFLNVYNLFRKQLNYTLYDSLNALTRENNSLDNDIKLYHKYKQIDGIKYRYFIGAMFNSEAFKRFEIDMEANKRENFLTFPTKENSRGLDTFGDESDESESESDEIDIDGLFENGD